MTDIDQGVQSLVGSFIFDDVLYFAQDDQCETVDGYLIATDDLVQRMAHLAKSKHTVDELETLDNINFYAIYKPASGDITVESAYWYGTGKSEKQGTFPLPLSQAEQEDLISAMEAYCETQNHQHCLAFLNICRVEAGLSALVSETPLYAVEKSAGPAIPETLFSDIQRLAHAIRTELEDRYGYDLSGFCIDASEILVSRLKCELSVDANIVEGWCQFDDETYGSDRPWDPHTWVEIPAYGLCIDITADQFNYGMSVENQYPKILVQKGLAHGIRYDEPSWSEYERDEPPCHQSLESILHRAQSQSRASFPDKSVPVIDDAYSR